MLLIINVEMAEKGTWQCMTACVCVCVYPTCAQLNVLSVCAYVHVVICKCVHMQEHACICIRAPACCCPCESENLINISSRFVNNCVLSC